MEWSGNFCQFWRSKQNFGVRACMSVFRRKRKRPVRSQKKEHRRNILAFPVCRSPGCWLSDACWQAYLYPGYAMFVSSFSGMFFQTAMYTSVLCCFETYKLQLTACRMSSYGTTRLRAALQPHFSPVRLHVSTV